MLEHRLKALEKWKELSLTYFGGDLRRSILRTSFTTQLLEMTSRYATDWKDVPEDIKRTFERLGIPEAEQKVLRERAHSTTR